MMYETRCTSRPSRSLLLGGIAFSALALASPAFSQSDAETSDQSATVANSVSESDVIVVTGTSIRGVAPTGSSLISIDREAAVLQGATTTSDLLSSVPQLGNFNTPQENSTPNRFRTGGYLPNIHGLGVYATLSLFNGHRFVPSGGEGVFTDPHVIPAIALERAEVIADGASSIYGSDAVAGVVNFIYRKNFDGVEFSSLYAIGDEYRKRNAALLLGETWDTGSVMFAYEFTDNRSPLTGDRSFTTSDNRYRGGRDSRTSSCMMPNIVADGVTYGLPDFGSANRCEQRLATTIVPNGERHAFLATVNQELGSRVELWAELNYANYTSNAIDTPVAMSIVVPNTNPYFIAPPGSMATEVTVNRSAVGLFSDPQVPQDFNSYGVTGGLRIDLGGDWEGNVRGHVSQTDDYWATTELDQAAAQALAYNTTLDTAFNPFGQAEDNNPAVLAMIDNGFASVNEANQTMRELQFSADGSLFAIPGGMVKGSFGGSVREEQTRQYQHGGTMANPIVVRDDRISRTVSAVFGELFIPIFGESNSVPGIRRLDLSASGRFDYYENLGGTFNPKFGLVWEPVYGLSLRGSYGTSYVAPNLGKITGAFGLPREGVSVSGFGTLNVYNQGGGNFDLESEEATTYSFGADWTPEYIPGLSLSVTYFDVDYTNLIYQPGTQDLFFNPFFADRIIFDPTPEQIAAAIAFAPPARAVPSHIDVIYGTYALNLGSRNVGGLDINARYSFETDSAGDFTFGVNALHYTKFDQQIFETQPVDSRLGTNEAIEWKGRASVGWNYDRFNLTLFANYIGSYENIGPSPAQHIPAFTTFDVAASYALPGKLDGFQVVLRAKNLFDRDPPFYDDSRGYDRRAHDPFGRIFEVSLRGSF